MYKKSEKFLIVMVLKRNGNQIADFGIIGVFNSKESAFARADTLADRDIVILPLTSTDNWTDLFSTAELSRIFRMYYGLNVCSDSGEPKSYPPILIPFS